MKKTLLGVTTALAATFGTTAFADEMPIKGMCTNGNEVVSFTGSQQPRVDPSTFDMGVTSIWMSLQDWDKMVEPNLTRREYVDSNGDNLISADFGSYPEVRVKTDLVNSTGYLEAASSTFDIYFKDHNPTLTFFGWECDIKPNF